MPLYRKRSRRNRDAPKQGSRSHKFRPDWNARGTQRTIVIVRRQQATQLFADPVGDTWLAWENLFQKELDDLNCKNFRYARTSRCR